MEIQRGKACSYSRFLPVIFMQLGLKHVVGFFLSFQYQLIARDHKSLQCDLGNILKQNKCILCVPHLFKKRDCLLSLFSRCRKNSKFDYRRVTIKKRNLTQMYRMAFLYMLSTIPLFFISMSYNKINGERIKGLQNL